MTTAGARPSSLLIRPADPADMAAIQAIYAHHVLYGIASFEEVPPDMAELSRRRADIVARDLPYLVAEREGAVRGYAYAGPYRPRPRSEQRRVGKGRVRTCRSRGLPDH